MQANLERFLIFDQQNPKSKHHPAHRGFTLVEILISVMILTIGLAGVTNLLLKGNQTAMKSRNLTAAGLVARTQLDRLVNAPFSELVGAGFPRNGNQKIGPVDYHWEAEIKDVNEEIARIHLRVRWQYKKLNQEQEFLCLRSK